MNDDLEIRAAKALGWKKCNENGQECRINCHNDLDGEHHAGNYFKFTTSYDWAMLGVKKIIENEDDIIFTYYLRIMIGVNCTVFTATPAQITQAWVEVLEKIESEKK